MSGLLISIVALSFLTIGFKNQELRLLTVFTGGIAALIVVIVSGLVPPWNLGYKELGQALALLKFPVMYQHLLKVVWLLVETVLLFTFLRLFFKELVQFFPVKTYWERFLLVSAALAAPVTVLIAVMSIIMLRSGYEYGVIILERHMPHIVFMLLTYFLLVILVPKRSSAVHQSKRFTFPQVQIAAYILIVVAFGVAQGFVFGQDRRNPRGLFLSKKPPEITVAACNISLTVSENDQVQVRLLMRPFVDNHRFLWNRVSEDEPENWEYYLQFVTRNLPLLLSTKKFELVSHYSDPDVPFFNRQWQRGARVIEAKVNLAHLGNLNEDTQELKLVDFWRDRRMGYIDLLEVNFKGEFQIIDVEVKPESALLPNRQLEKQLQWENLNFEESPAVSHITFKRLSSMSTEGIP